MLNETNCPNCAAPITGPKCEYCGTVFGHRMTDVDETIAQINMDIAASTQERLYALAIASMCGAITINEARKEFGLKEI